MISFEVKPEEDGVLLERVVLRRYQALSRNCLYKVLRKRDVRLDGRRISKNMPLSSGMQVTIYVTLPEAAPYRVVYENEWILLCEKPQGLLSEPDGSDSDSLLEAVNRKRLEEQPDADPYALCHRLDRNTGGLIFLCKKPEFTEEVSSALSARYYTKTYQAIVLGDARDITRRQGDFNFHWAHHFKDGRNKRVYVYGTPRTGTKPIETAIRFISYDGKKNVSFVEVQLITGRTHQIRAHLAFLGHPVVGDGKYGVEVLNRRLGYRYQTLWACCYEPASADAYNGIRQIQGIPIADILPQQTFTSEPDYR